MNELLTYLSTYGWILTLIAIAGIFLLGILKYCNAFAKLNEAARHCIYMLIAAGFSVIASVIYLKCTNALNTSSFFAIAGAIFALDQTFYALFKVTKIKDVFKMLLDFIFKHYDSSANNNNNNNNNN